MRDCETAAVKLAAKRSRRAGTVEAGYMSLYKWQQSQYGKYFHADMSEVLKCFRKWAKRFQGIK